MVIFSISPVNRGFLKSQSPATAPAWLDPGIATTTTSISSVVDPPSLLRFLHVWSQSLVGVVPCTTRLGWTAELSPLSPFGLAVFPLANRSNVVVSPHFIPASATFPIYGSVIFARSRSICCLLHLLAKRLSIVNFLFGTRPYPLRALEDVQPWNQSRHCRDACILASEHWRMFNSSVGPIASLAAVEPIASLAAGCM